MPQFKQARLKIQRADQYILDAKKRIDIVTSPNSQTAWIDVDADAGVQTIHYRLHKLRDIPDIALVIGDAIHNLKTALDYSWMEVIGKLAPSAISRRSKFPVYGTIEELKAGLHGIKIDRLCPRLYDFIVFEIKPYQAGNSTIFCLHDMDITDKHRVLIPTTNYGNVAGLKLHDNSRPIESWGGELGGHTTITLPLAHKIENTGHISVEIVFREGPLESSEVSETLRISSYVVLLVVELMEKFIER